MKRSLSVKANHVNSKTGLSKRELRLRTKRGSQISLPKLHVSRKTDDTITGLGGLGLLSSLMKSLNICSQLDRLKILKSYRPYTERDHIITHVLNLFVGGSAIEDIVDLQTDSAALRLIGAKRIPDPTTAGDFLRRFSTDELLNSLKACLDEALKSSWKQRFGRKKQELIEIDIDSHLHSVYGNQKEQADFNYKGGLGFHPLLFSVSGTSEVLRLINRPGNATSFEGAAAVIDELAPLLKERFKQVIFRGDSAFAKNELYDACEANGCYFAFGVPRWKPLLRSAEEIKEGSWKRKRFKAREPKRKRGTNQRREQVEKRQKRNLALKAEWYAEIPYTPERALDSSDEFRLIIRRQKLEVSEQQELFEEFRYSFYISNLPESDYTTEDVIAQTYQRCDQENVIEQLKNQVSAMRMPCREYHANSAYMLCAQLAQNLKCWLCLLALPRETCRWEWKRFRKSFVYFPVQVVHKARQVLVRTLTESRFTDDILTALKRLQV